MCGKSTTTFYDRKPRRVRDLSCGDTRVYLELEVRRIYCKVCNGVKREKIDFLASNPFYTKRFAHYIGERCRSSTIKDVAKEFKLDWHTVKDLDKEYMTALLAKVGTPAPTIIGVDEVSIRKGHTYRIVVSDLLRRRPIWFGGKDRSVDSMDAFYTWLGPKKTRKIKLAVMDMWKPFAKSLHKEEHAPSAVILFDKFHVMRHLGDALDEVRRSEYRRLAGKDRSFIKGQRYTLLSNRENLTKEGRQSLKKLLAANKRLQTAYLLRESFDRLWTYRSEAWMKKFFDNWKASLKWQRLEPFVKFAQMVERNWDGLAEYSRLQVKPPLGFVEGLNTKIRVIQRRSYGIRDEEYLRLKILTSMISTS
jgi:transposase